MKVTDLRRRLLAALAAGGMLSTGVVYSAPLDTNLLANPGFESVDDTGTLGAYNTPRITGWTASSPEKEGYAYSHNGSFSAGYSIPNYANGTPLATGGNWYFSPNAGPNNAVIDGPGQLFQDIDVSTGPSAALIAAGSAAYQISAWFGSYIDQGDIGHLHLDFRNSGGTSLGTGEVAGVLPLNEWTQNFRGGTIPVGTSTVRVSIFGTTPIGGGPDGYMDNVDFRITEEIVQPVLELTVNRDTGALTLANRTGAPVNLSGYSLLSDFEALAPANWRSIADNYDAGSPGANQVDPNNDWSELTNPNAHGDLSEADLETGSGASIASGRTINLGNAGTWIKNPNEDLTFEYVSNGSVVEGIVTYTANGGAGFLEGDFNVDGTINAADWAILRANQHTDMSGKSLAEAYRLGDLSGDRQSNHPDFIAFKALYDSANGAGSFAVMAGAVPEPASVLMVLGGALLLVPSLRRSQAR